MTLSANDVIKSKIEGVEDIFNDRVTTIKNWLQDQVDELAGECGAALKDFLERAADAAVNDNEPKPVVEDYFYKTKKFELSYIYFEKRLHLNIDGPFPIKIQQAIMECQLIDNPELLNHCNDIELVVINRKGTIIDTTLYAAYFGKYGDEYRFQLKENFKS